MIPVKSRMLQIAREWDRPFKADEMSEALTKEYPGEGRLTSFKQVDKQLEMYCRIDMLKVEQMELNGDELVLTYNITDIGRTSSDKYIPAKK